MNKVAVFGRDACGMFGLALIVAGVDQFSLGCALIVAGVLIVAAVVLLARRG